jgi:hypothetical protein
MSGDVTVSAAAAEPASTGDAPDKHASSLQALYFYGITRAKTFRAVSGEDAEGVLRIRYRDIEALTRHTTYETPVLEDAAVLVHQRVLETAMRRGTVLPAPFGIVFRGRKQLLRVLQDQYTVLEDGLSFLDGHWELRIHISPAARGTVDVELSDLAMQLYSELRQGVRAAVPFSREETRLVSAAFLVDRAAWLDFMKRAEDLGSQHPELSFDITGPWPAYDFVRIRD